MTWTVRTLQLPTVALSCTEHATEEAAWMAYLATVDAATERALATDEDLAIGVDLHHGSELIEQHWITLSNKIPTIGRNSAST